VTRSSYTTQSKPALNTSLDSSNETATPAFVTLSWTCFAFNVKQREMSEPHRTSRALPGQAGQSLGGLPVQLLRLRSAAAATFE
jgi:hypothetical protein